jgi:dihydrofolate synthase / folylpolyglutamate synthase
MLITAKITNLRYKLLSGIKVCYFAGIRTRADIHEIIKFRTLNFEMTYSETLDFLFSQLPAFHRIGKAAYRNDLDNTIMLDDYFGNPHARYPTIHVAGTNGKGSVSHMIASVLQEAGYKTGLYTSPHLKDFRERIRVNGEMIAEKEVVAFVADHKGILEQIKPSFFEMTVALAFNYFAGQKVDVAVIEVGLGGRLDSTNIINPVLSLITNIGHDHMDLLGDSLGKIAVEKSGVIKYNTPVVISETQPETQIVFEERARETNSLIYFADQEYICELQGDGIMDYERTYEINDLSANYRMKGMIPLKGDYQAKNLQGVYAAVNLLKDVFDISENNILEGIARVIINTGLSGRWQILGRSPLTVCDTGHNKEGLEYVLRQLKGIPKTALHMIIGFVNDKELSSILPLFPSDAFYYFTKAAVPRALNELILKAEASKYGLTGDSFTDVKSALDSARKNAKQTDLIFIGGSTFVVAEVV